MTMVKWPKDRMLCERGTLLLYKNWSVSIPVASCSLSHFLSLAHLYTHRRLCQAILSGWVRETCWNSSFCPFYIAQICNGSVLLLSLKAHRSLQSASRRTTLHACGGPSWFTEHDWSFSLPNNSYTCTRLLFLATFKFRQCFPWILLLPSNSIWYGIWNKMK